MQKEIIIALVASSAALITSLVSAYVSIRGQKIQETDNSISSKLDFLNKKVGMLEIIKNEILKTEIEERPEKQEFMVKAALVVQDIYFKRLTQLQSIDHYLDKAKLYEILKSSEEIIGNIAQLKILASKNKEEAFKSKELNSIVEAQPHKKMAEEIKNIELLITNELRETVLQISKLVKNE